MTIWEKICDSLSDTPAMPPRAGSGDIERGITVIAKVIADEKEREEKERREAEEARRCAEAFRKTLDSSPEEYSSIMYKSSSDSVQIADGGCNIFGSSPAKRRKPNLNAPVLSFAARLLMYVNLRCDCIGKIAYYRSGVSRQVYSRITCYDDSQADKLTVMKFCIGLQLERSAADLLMKSAGYAFSDTIPIDRAFTYAIENKMWNIDDVDAMLVRNSLPSLNLQF